MADDDDERAWYERLLEVQLMANPAIWHRLGLQGITEETPLQLGFLFLAPEESAADALVGFLAEETDYEVQGRRQGKGRAAQWVVAGVTQPAAVSLETINAWVQWMVAAGVANGPCAFDGWTAAARHDAPAPPAAEAQT